MKKVTGVYMEESLKNRFQKIAADLGLNQSTLLRLLILEKVEMEEKKNASQ
ncbi:MAG: ribbon-helix-helix protein, CopG family [Thermoplasmata archaeon]|nr:ribbon-helix-helix protein, CopG family [Thermoplasmata archaeon]MBE3142293.1 ribbon-helix-helix protein, CopG family [Thermoplasmata archaeon]